MPTTSSVQLPDFLALTRVFSLRTNRHCYTVTAASEQAWLVSELLSDDERSALKSLKTGLWAAVCFPTCDASQLRLAMDFMTALLLHSSRMRCGKDYELFEHVFPKVVASMPTDLSRQTLSVLCDEFKAAQERLLVYRHSNTLPNLDDYIALRRNASGIPMLLSLVEMVEGLKTIPNNVNLKRLAADLISLSLDVFAYNNEQQAGNQLNLIAVIQAEKGVSVQGAINLAFTHIERTLREFRMLVDPASFEGSSTSAWDWLRPRKTPPSSPIVDGDTQLFIRGLEDCIVGTLNWSYDTELFFGTKGDEVRQYGWVFLRDSNSA
ncbi:hypothetical protein MIND_01309400 [Mycena indigotica]|uniref:Terpenoid synthase n=1 Tax=Mycena indigotica TaxID=2126181 RepID=A0A8H6S0Z7_9AGAR|nr:uncharacterized protein MIND_01309400 [Mycena indigotica]KAF7290691.1 hypothetical protein MIND_01309400 [Mycena indigotica]